MEYDKNTNKCVKKARDYINDLFEFNIDNIHFRFYWMMDEDGNIDEDSGVGHFIKLKFPSHLAMDLKPTQSKGL